MHPLVSIWPIVWTLFIQQASSKSTTLAIRKSSALMILQSGLISDPHLSFSLPGRPRESSYPDMIAHTIIPIQKAEAGGLEVQDCLHFTLRFGSKQNK